MNVNNEDFLIYSVTITATSYTYCDDVCIYMYSYFLNSIVVIVIAV